MNTGLGKDGGKSRKRSEPHSLHAWHAVLFGRHHESDREAPIKTIAAAALIMTPGAPAALCTAVA